MNWIIETIILTTISMAYWNYALRLYNKYYQESPVLSYLVILMSTICFVFLMIFINEKFDENHQEQHHHHEFKTNQYRRMV